MRIEDIEDEETRKLATKRMKECRGFMCVGYSLSAAFYWKETKEGYIFWRNINYKLKGL